MNTLADHNSERPNPQEQPQGFLKSTIRHLGNRVMQELIERSYLVAESEIDMMVRHENETIDWRKAGHEINIFKQKNLNEAESTRLTELKVQFLERLAGCNTIAERFALFMDEEYADDIYTLDLGETQQAGSHDAVEAIKSEYHELERMLVEQGVIEGEQPRNAAKRTVHFAKSNHPDYYQVTRNRTLFCFEQGDRKISVSKRMTFLLDKSVVPAESNPLDPKHNGRVHVALTQKLIDTQAEAVVPVRTVYFAASKPLKESK